MFIGEAFRQVADTGRYLRVLDLCAAPGGKSTHLSSLIGPGGLLVANEVIRQRASILADNITRWGAANTIITQNDPAQFSSLPGFFDLILVDAPCSGEGMFRDAVARREWSEENASLCAERQKRILTDVWPALKEGGILIYSTCTFNPSENEENILWLVDRTGAEPVRLDTENHRDITEIEHKIIWGYGFYPGRIKGEGLFISVIRKTDKSGNTVIKERKVNEPKLSKEDLKIAGGLTSFPDISLVKEGEEIISAAGTKEDYLYLGRKLRIIKNGTSICRLKNRGFIPSHQLALSEGYKTDAFPVVELDYRQAIFFLRRENLVRDGLPKGWLAVTWKGVNLGFINNIGNRINNYYPMNWRIRMEVAGDGTDNIIEWQ